ncbi:MAG TPA: LLM class flavin-dependent oxidoreductase [Myxococcales bacterium]|nr:LLM class flavin-dependent oxidoreductase [Myxococcales bacterium]
MAAYSILDLAPVVEGGDAGTALRCSLDLARHAERWGYRRYWVAEHHGMPGVASAATAVVICHVASGTSSIRVGAGGVMLPNHAPLIIAEQFGTLEALFPGRIDLGVGRAPGTDPVTSHALRRTLDSDVDAFPQDVLELMEYFRPPQPGQRVIAVPGAGSNVPIWILGSSLYGARLAAAMGLPYAFASHFAPAQLQAAIDLYRAEFRPSSQLAQPYVMAGVNVIAADTDEEAALLATSLEQAVIKLRMGRPGRLPPPRPGTRWSGMERAVLDQVLNCSAIGSVATVRKWLADFIARTGVDEVIIASQIFDHAARLRSYELAAEALSDAPRAASGMATAG